MEAIILAGGLGTRLREETEFRPKPMVEIGGKPILWHIMKNLNAQGVDHFIIATGYKSEMVKDYFLSYHARNHDITIDFAAPEDVEVHGMNPERWKVTVAYTGDHTLTAGRILRASKYLHGGPFLVTYGDGLADVNVGDLLETHRRHGRRATVTTVQPMSRFGVADIGDDDRVERFREKPRLDGWINVGYFIMEQDALGYLRDDAMLEDGPLDDLAAAGELTAYRHHGFWQPMDTYRETVALNALWETGAAPWRTWE